jgi:hypothetical protein
MTVCRGSTLKSKPLARGSKLLPCYESARPRTWNITSVMPKSAACCMMVLMLFELKLHSNRFTNITRKSLNLAYDLADVTHVMENAISTQNHLSIAWETCCEGEAV